MPSAFHGGTNPQGWIPAITGFMHSLVGLSMLPLTGALRQAEIQALKNVIRSLPGFKAL